jgi:hypothetical protein
MLRCAVGIRMNTPVKKTIISVSRRTDIPAYYYRWFVNRLKEGYAGYINPFGGQRYLISLRPETVRCFVFWSKNFAPFIPYLDSIEAMGYRFYFNFTITALPVVFEPGRVDPGQAVQTLKDLSARYSPRHVNWRYDPIVLSPVTDRAAHIRTFSRLAEQLEGCVERCIFSFVHMYGKVARRYAMFQKTHGIPIHNPDQAFRLELAEELAGIAEKHGIRLLSCADDTLLTDTIGKAHCVDGELIQTLFPDAADSYRLKPTRKDCGCSESRDIGAYDTCPHGCLYCYANANRETAMKRYRNHDDMSEFLGFSNETPDERNAW